MIEDLPQQYKDLGVDGLKTLMQAGGLPPPYNRVAAAWIAKMVHQEDLERRDTTSQQLVEASRAATAAERAALAAERQAEAAEKANARATIALVISIISIIVSIVLAALKFQA